jgi:hypothetical protein
MLSKKGFCGGLRATLIQDQKSMRNLDLNPLAELNPVENVWQLPKLSRCATSGHAPFRPVAPLM